MPQRKGWFFSTKRALVFQSLSRVWIFATPWTAARQASLPFTISWSLLKHMSIELVMPSKHLILCRPLLLPSIFPRIRVFSNELTSCIRWPKYWSFSVSISPSNEYSGFISFRVDWFDLLAVLGTLKSLLQHHNLKYQFFGAQPSLWSNSHIHTCLLEKTELWLYGPLSAKWCLCFLNMLSRFVIAFLPKSKHLLISWMQSPSAVILEPMKIKSVTACTFSPSTCH